MNVPVFFLLLLLFTSGAVLLFLQFPYKYMPITFYIPLLIYAQVILIMFTDHCSICVCYYRSHFSRTTQSLHCVFHSSSTCHTHSCSHNIINGKYMYSAIVIHYMRLLNIPKPKFFCQFHWTCVLVYSTNDP